MNEGYCIDIYIEKEPKWIHDSLLICKQHPQYGMYWQANGVTKYKKQKIIRKLNKKGIKYRAYEKRWERSGDYRKKFLASYPPPYRCRYCNKKITADSMQIDHIIPVAKAKKSVNARMMLYIQGISEVNDIRNLAASCRRCNSRKSDKTGIWWIKGILGRYKWYWLLRKIFFLCLIAIIIYFTAAFCVTS